MNSWRLQKVLSKGLAHSETVTRLDNNRGIHLRIFDLGQDLNSWYQQDWNKTKGWCELQEEDFKENLPTPQQLKQPKYLWIQTRLGLLCFYYWYSSVIIFYSTVFHQCDIQGEEKCSWLVVTLDLLQDQVRRQEHCYVTVFVDHSFPLALCRWSEVLTKSVVTN